MGDVCAGKRVLFIGNSFTYYNDMPEMVSKLAGQAGFAVCTSSVTKGGWYLRKFTDPESEKGQELRQVYRERKWDYVVLQDQSFQPAGDPEATLASVQALCKLLDGGEQILLYQTWAYKDHSEKLAGTGMDYDAMRDKLRDTYEKAAQMTGGIRVPVGDAFSLCRETHPEIELYQEDGYHPTLVGSYAAACLFFHAITGADPNVLPAPEDLDAAEAAVMRHIAGEAAERENCAGQGAVE